jgi:hypothetical protein
MKQDNLAKYILSVDRETKALKFANDRQHYERFLSSAAVMLAKLFAGENIDSDVRSHEKLIGELWLQDEDSHKKMYAYWQDFKDSK